MQITTTSLTNDLAEGQDAPTRRGALRPNCLRGSRCSAIYDDTGQAAGGGRAGSRPEHRAARAGHDPGRRRHAQTVGEEKDDDDRHRLALRRVTILPHNIRYIVVAGSSLEPTDEELESLREILAYVVPIALVLGGIGGWFLARHSLSPVSAMVERARKMSAENLSGRLPVANPRDEIGRLAETFNDLLSRLEASMTTQRE